MAAGTSIPETLDVDEDDGGGWKEVKSRGKAKITFAEALKSNKEATRARSWIEAIGSNIELKGSANFYAPQKNGEEIYQLIDDEDYEESKKLWQHSIYAYMAGKRPYFVHFNAYIKRIWKPKGSWDVFPRDNGFYLIKFELEEDFQRIINGGPWFMDSKLILMRKWEADFNFEHVMLTTYPIWIKFNNLDLALWNMRCISKLASIIGRPIDIDENTRKLKKIKFARVLVEISANTVLPKTVKAIDKRGFIYNQEVEYEFVPPKCGECFCFGHTNLQCQNKVTDRQKIWVEKPKNTSFPFEASNPKNQEDTTKNLQNISPIIIPSELQNVTMVSDCVTEQESHLSLAQKEKTPCSKDHLKNAEHDEPLHDQDQNLVLQAEVPPIVEHNKEEEELPNSLTDIHKMDIDLESTDEEKEEETSEDISKYTKCNTEYGNQFIQIDKGRLKSVSVGNAPVTRSKSTKK